MEKKQPDVGVKPRSLRIDWDHGSIVRASLEAQDITGNAYVLDIYNNQDQLRQLLSSVAKTLDPKYFHSCMISYSHKDEEFVTQLARHLDKSGVNVWYADKDMKSGRKIHEQIYEAIHGYDKLLIVLSAESMKSNWVMSEIRRARKMEQETGRRKLFPIRLVDFDTIRQWECFDADTGKDLAIEVREYFIPDFSNWRSQAAFDISVKRLLNDLTADSNTEG